MSFLVFCISLALLAICTVGLLGCIAENSRTIGVFVLLAIVGSMLGLFGSFGLAISEFNGSAMSVSLLVLTGSPVLFTVIAAFMITAAVLRSSRPSNGYVSTCKSGLATTVLLLVPKDVRQEYRGDWNEVTAKASSQVQRRWLQAVLVTRFICIVGGSLGLSLLQAGYIIWRIL